MKALMLLVFGALFISGQTPAVQKPAILTPAWVSLTRLATERHAADDFAAGELLRREALRLAEEKLGPMDIQLAPLLTNLAISLHAQGRASEADTFARRAFMIAEQAGDQKLLGVVLNTLGVVLAGEYEFARAEPVMRRSVALLEQSAGADSLDFAKAANNLATLYSDTHQYVKAEQEMKRALPLYEKHLGPEHPDFAMALSNMFTILADQHRINEGEPYLRRALAIGEKKFPQSLYMANLQHCLAAFEADRQNFKEAAYLLEKVIATQERLLGPEHPQVGYTLVNYSGVLRHLHQKNDAKQAQNRANTILKSSFH